MDEELVKLEEIYAEVTPCLRLRMLREVMKIRKQYQKDWILINACKKNTSE